MEIMLKLGREDIQRWLPYTLIGETASRSIWNTQKRKNLWKKKFSDKELEQCRKIVSLSKKWMLTTGIPDEIIMCKNTFELWRRVGEFCLDI